MTQRGWIRLACLAGALTVIGLTISFSHRAGDFAGYLLVGELALHGRDIYREAPLINTWPPVFTLLCVPLALLARVSLVGTRVLWLLFNWGALVVALRAARDLVYGGDGASTRTALPPMLSAAVLLPLLLSIRWVSANFEHLQINITILALTLIGLVWHRAGRDRAGGFAIGTAAALKVMAVLFVPYFLWRRQWRAAFWTTLFAAAWSVLPVLFYGVGGMMHQYAAWRDGLQVGWGVGKMNLSVYAMADRLIGHRLVPFANAGVDALPASGSRAVVIAAGALLLLVTIAACWLFRGAYRPGSRATVAEWSIVLLVSSIFGTVAWKYYLVTLLLPMMLFVATWRDASVPAPFRRTLRRLTWISFALGFVAARDIVGADFSGRLEMGSLITVMALLILGTLFWYRARIAAVAEA